MTNEIRSLLHKILSHEASADEMEKFHAWLLEDPDHKLLFRDIEAAWANELEETITFDAERGLERLNQKIRTAEAFDFQKELEWKPETFSWIKIAASIVFIIVGCLSLFFVYIRFAQRKEEVALKLIETKTLAGQKMTITLSDSSKIYLNSRSTLIYPENFSGGKREVYLEGEAFFEVTPNKKKAFVIHTDSMLTTVLGTSFSVSSYRDKDNIKLTVLTGKVAFSSDNSAGQYSKPLAYLTANQEMVYDKKEGSITQSIVNASEITAWKDGKLIFRDVPFNEIISSMEKWYGVKIILKGNALKRCRFTAQFNNVALTQALDMLKISTDFKYELKENVVMISGQKCR